MGREAGTGRVTIMEEGLRSRETDSKGGAGEGGVVEQVVQ